MSKQNFGWFLFFSLLSLTIFAVPAAAQPPPPGSNNPIATPPPDPRTGPTNLAAAAQTAKNPKLDSALTGLVAAAKVSSTAAKELAESQSLRLSDNRVHIQIVTSPAGLAQVTKAVAEAGGQVTGTGFSDTLVQGWLPIAAVERVAAQDDVYYIRRPPQVYSLENLYVGNSTTEALAAINTPAWHTAGYTGAGVKVAIIDAGFVGYSSLRGSDLPASVTVKNFVDGETDAQADGTTEHGTACAEIIHDLAPGAQLYLVKIATDLDLAEAVAWLISQQVDIISTSVGFYNASPGDGTGPLAGLVSQARSAGILWVTAAGNDRETHWGGLYADNNSNNIHEFEGEEVNCFSGSLLGQASCDGFSFFIVVGLIGQINILVRWNDWTAVDQDYDLHLVRWNGSSWVQVASSTDPQTGAAGQAPTEWINYKPTGNEDLGTLLSPHGFVLERINGNRPVNFELFTPQLGGLLRPDKILRARSLANLADAPEAMTVAALNVNTPYDQEFYSSEGPMNGLGGAATGGAIKPDIAGYANVSTESYGAGVFNGTSSATPHVAGAAAIALSAYPGYGPTQLQTFLEETAVDMGTAGLDTQFGYGRLFLGEPPAGINTPPSLTGLPDQSVPVDGSLDNAIDLWTYAGDAQDDMAALAFTIKNTPAINAGVSLDSNRYIDINPSPGWTGETTVEIQVQDSGGLTATDSFDVVVSSGGNPTHYIYFPAVSKTGL